MSASSSRPPLSPPPHYPMTRPSSPVRLGVVARGAGAILGPGEGSPYYTPGVWPTRGYTGMSSSLGEMTTTGPDLSGYMTRVPAERAAGDAGSMGVADQESVGGVVRVTGDGVEDGVIRLSSDSGEGRLPASQEAVSSEIVMWEPESPILEVVVVSSGAEGETEQEDRQEIAEEAEEEPEMDMTATLGDDIDDPDLAVGS